MLVSRISYATLFGPLFAWYLLACGIKGLVVMGEPKATYYKEYSNFSDEQVKYA